MPWSIIVGGKVVHGQLTPAFHLELHTKTHPYDFQVHYRRSLTPITATEYLSSLGIVLAVIVQL